MEENKMEGYLRRQLFWSRVTALAALGMLALLTVSAFFAAARFQEIYVQLSGLEEELSQMLQNTNRMLNSVNNGGLEKIYEALNQVNDIDIETLNESIEQLNKVIRPLASLFG